MIAARSPSRSIAPTHINKTSNTHNYFTASCELCCIPTIIFTMTKLQNLISWRLLQQLKILNIAPVAPKGTIPSLSYSSVANAILSRIPHGTWCASHAGAPRSSVDNNHDRWLRCRRSSSQIGENWNFNDKSKELGGAADEESTDSTMLYFHVSPR